MSTPLGFLQLIFCFCSFLLQMNCRHLMMMTMMPMMTPTMKTLMMTMIQISSHPSVNHLFFFAPLIVELHQVLPVYHTSSADSKPTCSSVGFFFFAVLLSASLALLSSDDDFGKIFACFFLLSAFDF